jgi:acid stress-induced BolA-like protein IbaG/YrbA
VSPQRDCSQLEVTVVSPFFEDMAKFKRKDLVNQSLQCLRREPNFHSQVVTMNLYSPSEIEETNST